MKSKKKSTRQSLYSSVVLLVLCISMLVGTTFAWFTDNVTSSGNIIKSGNLDLEMYWTDDLESGEWFNVEDEEHNTIFNYDNWEPGYTEVKYIKLVNKGNLALNYNLTLTPTGSVGKLAEVINVFYANNGVEMKDRSDLSSLSAIGLLNNVMDGGATADGTLLADDQQSPWHKSGETIITLAMNMITTAGNEYQDETIGDGFTITALATQCPYEEDSFGSDYDANAEYPEVIKPSKVSASVTPVDGKVPAGGVTLAGSGIAATVPEGVLLEDGVDTLTLTVTPLEHTTSDITVVNNEILIPVDVHIEGVSEKNTTPIIIDLGAIMPKYLNMGNYKLFHIEDGTNNEMTLVDAKDELNAHNQFTYNPVTGEVSVAMASFSEVAMVADTSAAWQGGDDYSWYNTDDTSFKIANADQLHAFSQIVGGIAKDKDGNAIAKDSFDGKTVKLLSDINLNHGTVLDNAEGTTKTIFYPIGYYNNKEFSSEANSNRPTNAETGVESTVDSFAGTFDGNGHTIANFYQNTWEMFGDYNSGYSNTPNYYKDAMGLFGYVNGGIIKNLTVNNFESDGEFTPTGVIAAYAAGNATFENIAITHCNPRVYNTGNGGIIGIAGSTESENDDHIILKNITVDNTNKISALWGSWDVACGGLVGMYRGNVNASGNATGDTVSFTNCHVAAQIDVYNDVCANYQYYAYRYAGMIIGSVRHNTTDEEGKTIPNMTGISASGCTVNYGTWNDYYYCEFEKNTMASYSEDYQFSRVPHSELDFTDLDGNNEINSIEERNSVTGCLHDHTDAEDKRAIYLPFHQLFTGYSWGVNSIGLEQYSGIVTDLDITEGDQNESVEKFEKKFTGDFLYRVGNQNAVSVGSLFAVASKKDANGNDLKDDNGNVIYHNINSSGVIVSIDKLSEDMNVSGKYTPDTETWTNGKIEFSGSGVVKVTIQDYNFCTPTVLYLEVVDAKNITTAIGSSGTDVVLLNEVKISSGSTVTYDNCFVYGNGFTFDVRGGLTKYVSSQGWGVINISGGATLDNLVIIGDVYETYGAYTDNDYNTAAVASLSGSIQNCYISNCAAPVMARGTTTVKDTTLYGGTVANMIIKSGVNTLENVTTVNYNDDRAIVGAGIVVHSDADEATRLILNGTLKQYNFLCETPEPTDSNAQILYDAMFDASCSSYQFGTSPNRYVNTGIISMTESFDADNITDNASTGYVGQAVQIQVQITTVNGYVYTQPNTIGSVNNNYDAATDAHKASVQGDYLPTFEFDLGNQEISYDGDSDSRYLYGDANGVKALYQEGDDAITLDLSNLATVYKYTDKYLSVSTTCKDSSGNVLTATDGKVTLSSAGEYSLVFTVVDNLFYGADGTLSDKSVTRTYTVPLSLSVKAADIKDAEITISPTTLEGTYETVNLTDYKLKLEFLNCIKVTDYDKSGNGTTVDLTTNIASATLENSADNLWSAASVITITYTDGRVLTVNLSKFAGSSPGTKTGNIVTNDGVYFLSDGALNNKPTEDANKCTCTITSVSFKGNNSATITNDTDVSVSWPIESSDSSTECVTPDTLITLADGSQVRVDSLTGDEQLLVWNMETGSLDSAPIMFVDSESETTYEVIKLCFSDGTEVKVISEHGFWDYDLNKYVYLDENAAQYIGHSFAKQSGDALTKVQLVDVVLETEVTTAWSPVTAGHLCYFVNGMLSMPGGVGGLFNIFDVDAETMTYDYETMARDIETYGLFTYEELSQYAELSREMFDAAGGQYLKVSIGKGNLTVDELVAMIERYGKFFE